MARTPGLFTYLSLAALTASAARRRIAGEIARGGPGAARLPERLGKASAARPIGPLIWLHASSSAHEGALLDLAGRLVQDLPDAGFLLTTDHAPVHAQLPDGAVHQYVPHEASGAVTAFLDHWRPDFGLWCGAQLRPALIAEAAERGFPQLMIDASGQIGPHGWTRLVGATLRKFQRILVADDEVRDSILQAGASPQQVEVAGPLQEEVRTLPCSLAERNAIGEILKSRPVWLATSVIEAEDDAIITAHRRASRLAHRLMLILSPDQPERGAALAKRMSEEGFVTASRSVEGEPDRETEVFIADGDADLGLWYRLAPVTFMGSTLAPEGKGGRSPLEPAALGSAILHGPGVGPHSASYARFAEAAAARMVTSGAELGEALAELLSPDKAAGMAHSAWRVSTGGADLTERVATLVRDAFVQSAAS